MTVAKLSHRERTANVVCMTAVCAALGIASTGLEIGVAGILLLAVAVILPVAMVLVRPALGILLVVATIVELALLGPVIGQVWMPYYTPSIQVDAHYYKPHLHVENGYVVYHLEQCGGGCNIIHEEIATDLTAPLLALSSFISPGLTHNTETDEITADYGEITFVYQLQQGET